MHATPQRLLAEQIVAQIDQAKTRYERLVLVVGPPGSGKTTALFAVERSAGYPYLSLGLELSRRLLDVPLRERPYEAATVVSDVVEQVNKSVVLLDNLEILFDRSLCLNPLNLLRKLSRNRVVVAAWPGVIDGGSLVYAASDHPESRRDPASDLLVVSAGPTSSF